MMNAYIKFLTAARSLASQGVSKEQILNFARREFGKIGTKGLFRKQIDNIFKSKKPVGKKDPDFDNTVEKMVFDDEGKPFNPRNPLKKADGGRIGFGGGSDMSQVADSKGNVGPGKGGYQGAGDGKGGKAGGPGDGPDDRGTAHQNMVQSMVKAGMTPSQINQATRSSAFNLGKTILGNVVTGGAFSLLDPNVRRAISAVRGVGALKDIYGNPTATQFGLGNLFGGTEDEEESESKKDDLTGMAGNVRNMDQVMDRQAQIEARAKELGFADGGRIGYAMGSEGIMQMASVDDPFYRSGDEDEHSLRMFNKPYKELNADELEEFREEMMRLMNKFASAPDPMDERNMVMENIAIQEFGKPLKDLSDEEIIQIDEMIDNMTEKPKQAPSIKLADGGITRIGLKDGPKDPRRRGFMKAAVGIASMLPFGIGKGVKVAAPVVKKAVEISEPALAKIVETVMSAGKLISITGKRVKDMVTKRKLKNVEVEEDIADGSYIIKKDGKEIYYKPGRMDETGGIDDSIIEVIEDTVTKKAGGGIARMLGE